jgi:hypothetical protein
VLCHGFALIGTDLRIEAGKSGEKEEDRSQNKTTSGKSFSPQRTQRSTEENPAERD